MSLVDDILIDIQNGLVNQQFSPNDLLTNQIVNVDGDDVFQVGNKIYKKASIQTYIPNYAIEYDFSGKIIGIGAQVKRGYTPKFKRHSPGIYSILNNQIESQAQMPQANPGGGDDQGAEEYDDEDKEVPIGCIDKAKIFRDFVDYLSQKPFRILLPNGRWYPGSGAITGWKNRLDVYVWPIGNIPNWQSTKTILKGFSEDISVLMNTPDPDHERARKIYNDIRTWGNPRGSEQKGKDIYNWLRTVSSEAWNPLDNGNNNPRLDSTLTKLYALAKPEEFVIYDSRVASAILNIAEDIYRRSRIGLFRKHFPNIGHMNGAASSGTRPRGYRTKWPNAYRVWAAQMEANELCRGLRDELNRRRCDNQEWNLRMVEAVLFMEGY